MFNKCVLILTLLLTSTCFYGCESDTSITESIVEEPVVEEPAIEPVVENNFCSVGDVLQPGESCLDGTGDAFTVLEDGFGRYLFFNVGEGINLFGNINGKVRNFSAKKQDNGTWKILSVTPKE